MSLTNDDSTSDRESLSTDSHISVTRVLAMYIDAARRLRVPVTRAEVREAFVPRNKSRRCGACDRVLRHGTPYGYLERVSALGLCLLCIDAILATNAVRAPVIPAAYADLLP